MHTYSIEEFRRSQNEMIGASFELPSLINDYSKIQQNSKFMQGVKLRKSNDFLKQITIAPFGKEPLVNKNKKQY